MLALEPGAWSKFQAAIGGCTMSDQLLGEEPRTYFIGGDNSATRWITPRRVWQLLGGLALLVAVVATVTVSQSLLVLVVWAAAIGLAAHVLRRRDRKGGGWAGSWAERLRATLAWRFGWDAYDPELEGTPFVLGRVAVLAPSATEDSPELAVIDRFVADCLTDTQALLDQDEHQDAR